jgi:hypothetical protein
VVDRKQLNHRIRKLAHGALGLDVETYRTIVAAIAEKSEGHITRCTDDEANLVMLALERMAAGGVGATSVTLKNQRQQKFIARLMDYLGWTWRDTAGFCFHQTGKRSTRQCSAGELSKIVIGMIAIIDHRINREQIKLTPDQLAEYHRYTKLHRPRPNPIEGERSAA